MSRILRTLVCFLLICCMLVNLSPLRSNATTVGATAAITAASTVLSPAGMVVGATFIALGLAAAANPEGFQNMVDAGVSALESAGTWVKDGMVELLRTEDADGNASYYVDSGLIEDVRSHVFDTGVVTDFSGAFTTSKYIDGYTYRSSKPFYVFSFSYKQSGYSQTYYTVTLGASGTSVQLISDSGSVAGTRTCNDKISDDLYYSASGSTYQTSYNYLGHFTSSTYASHVNAIKALASNAYDTYKVIHTLAKEGFKEIQPAPVTNVYVDGAARRK